MSTYAPAPRPTRLRTTLIAAVIATLVAAIAAVAPTTSNATVVSGSAAWTQPTWWYGYVDGTAGSSITPTGGGSLSGQVLSLAATGGTYADATGSGTVNLTGGIEYSARSGAVYTKIENVRITIPPSGSTGALVADVTYRPYPGTGSLASSPNLHFANVLGVDSSTVSGPTTTWASKTVQLTAGGAAVFDNPFQPVSSGDPFGPITFAATE